MPTIVALVPTFNWFGLAFKLNDLMQDSGSDHHRDKGLYLATQRFITSCEACIETRTCSQGCLPTNVALVPTFNWFGLAFKFTDLMQDSGSDHHRDKGLYLATQRFITSCQA